MGLDREFPEVGVVRDDDTPRRVRASENDDVIAAAKAFLYDRSHVLASRSQALHDVGMNVLVGEEPKVERTHAGIFRSQITSFFKERAAY